jgi:hypothetical protein
MTRTWTTYAHVHAGEWIQGAVGMLYVQRLERQGQDIVLTLEDATGHRRVVRRGPRQSVRVWRQGA